MQSNGNTVTLTTMRPVTRTYPRILTETTDVQLADDAIAAFYETAKDAPGALYYRKDALAVVVGAMQEGGAVVVRYEHDNEVTARVIFPNAVMLTKDNHITVRGFCTYRQAVRSFRCDKMANVHLLVMPGETTLPAPVPDPDVVKADAESAAWHEYEREMARTPVPAYVAPVDANGEPLY